MMIKRMYDFKSGGKPHWTALAWAYRRGKWDVLYSWSNLTGDRCGVNLSIL
jgi:hypothetical protein